MHEVVDWRSRSADRRRALRSAHALSRSEQSRFDALFLHEIADRLLVELVETPDELVHELHRLLGVGAAKFRREDGEVLGNSGDVVDDLGEFLVLRGFLKK